MHRTLILSLALCIPLRAPAQRLEDLTHAEVRNLEVQVLVLPIGSCEPHGYHLPYGNDTWTVEALARRAAAQAIARGAKVLVLPAMPYGVNVNLASLPRAQSLSPATMLSFVKDVVDTAERQGIRKVVILNGHGGNTTTLGAALRELFASHRKVFVSLIYVGTMFAGAEPKIFTDPGAGAHAGEAETALALALYPEKVNMDRAVRPRAGRVRLRTAGAAGATFVSPWEQVSDTTGGGDPAKATPANGEKLVNFFVERVSSYLLELSAAEMTDAFPY